MPPQSISKTKKIDLKITGGSIKASGDLILSDGGVTDVFLKSVAIHSPGGGYLLKVLNADAIQPTEVNLMINQEKALEKTLRGNIFAAEGSKANVTLKSSELIGWATANSLSIDADSTWSITGPSILKHLTHEGNIKFNANKESGVDKTIKNNNYVTLSLETLSGNGMFWMNTDIAGHKGDFLNVTGKAKGNFGVRVNDSGKSPQPEDSLKIIQTGGGDAKFTLANQGGVVDVGTYQYYLVPDDRNGVPDDTHRVLDDRQRTWSLVSHQPEQKILPEKPLAEASTLSPTAYNVDEPQVDEAQTKPAFSKETLGAQKNEIELDHEIYPEGIEIKGQHTFKNKPMLSVTKSQPKSPAVTVSEGATLNLNGAQDQWLTVTTTGKRSPGFFVSGQQTKMTADKMVINTHGEDSEGLTSQGGAQVNITNVHITGQEDGFSGLSSEGEKTHLSGSHLTIESKGYGRGVEAANGAEINLEDSTLIGTGEDFSGIWAHGKTTRLEGKNMTIMANDKNGSGVRAYKGATVNMMGSHIQGKGDNFLGISAFQENTHVTGSKIHIDSQGKNSKGLSAAGGGQAILEESTLVGVGENFIGLSATEDKTHLKANQTTITVNNKNGKGVKSLDRAQLSIQGSHITGTGANFFGLLAEGDNTKLTGNNLEIQIDAQKGTAVLAQNASTLTLNDSKVIGERDDFLGLVANAQKTKLEGNKITLELNGKNSQGVKATSGAQVNIHESTMTGTQEDFSGLSAEGDKTRLVSQTTTIKSKGKNGKGVNLTKGAQVDIQNSTLIGEGSDFVGILASEENTNLTGNQLKMKLNAQNGKGVTVYKDARVDLQGSEISGTEAHFYGMAAYQENSHLKGHQMTIASKGNHSRGVSAISGAQVSIEDSTITGTGENFLGLSAYLEHTDLTAKKLNLQLKEKNSIGVDTQNGANTQIQGSTITLEGENAVGLSAFGDNTTLTANTVTIEANGQHSKGIETVKGATINIDNSFITTRGASSPVAKLSQKGTLKLSEAHLSTVGIDSPIFYAISDNTKEKSVAEMTKGSLKSRGDLILSQGGLMNVVLNHVLVSSPGSGYLLNVLGSDSGDHGEVNLLANQTNLSGRIFAAEGSTADVTLNGSVLTGKVEATRLFIDPLSTWSVTEHSQVNQLTNEGHIQFQPQGDMAFKKVSMQTLNGTGLFSMNTDIAGHRGDFLEVTGEANGHFEVSVSDSGKNPQPEDSLKIIQTGGGDADFILANPGQVVDVGTYQYYLVPDDSVSVPDNRERALDNRRRGWSLMSHQSQLSLLREAKSESHPPSSVIEGAATVTPISGEIQASEQPAHQPSSGELEQTRLATGSDLPSLPIIETASTVTPLAQKTQASEQPMHQLSSQALEQTRLATGSDLSSPPIIETASTVTPLAQKTQAPEQPMHQLSSEALEQTRLATGSDLSSPRLLKPRAL